MSDRAARIRRWYEYKLLVLLMILAGIGIIWVVVRVQRTRQQQEAADAITDFGGQVRYDYQPRQPVNPLLAPSPPGPAPLRNLLGENFFATLVDVNLTSSSVTDAGLGHLIQRLAQLQELNLFHTQITDAGLEHLQELTHLEYLCLWGTQVSDAGLEHLKGLTQLRTLLLNNTRVTDAGLEHLKGLPQLQTLDVRGTKVTDAGVKKLQQALPNCKIDHSST